MSQPNQELSGDDLAAFDSLIGHLEEQGRMSINLRELRCPFQCEKQQQRAENQARREEEKHYRHQGFSRIDSLVDVENVGLGRLSRGISLGQLIEIRRSLQP